MIELRKGDILKTDAEAVVNTVNCVGFMGRGIALQMRKAYPDNFEVYKAACDREEVQPGKMLVVETNQFHNPRYIINFPTKRHWKGKSQIGDIRSGLVSLVEEIRARHIRSIAIPPLGCGLGGLDWDDVRPLIEAALKPFRNVEVMLFEPAGAPAAALMAKHEKAPKMTPGRAALLGLMRRYLEAVMDPWVTLLEIHKLMYFMQEAGEPLKLRYAKALYGPYAENLRHVLSAIEGHFIVGYGDAEDNPEKEIEVLLEPSTQADNYLREHQATHDRFDRVVDLIEGFETPYGMELLATVHWVCNQESATSADDAVRQVYAWNDRKQKLFPEPHIRLAFDVLKGKGWTSPVN